MNIVRKTYDWVLHWADTPWGVTALFIIAFVESSFFPVPPDVLLIALCLGIPKKSFKYAAIATAGSVLGAMFGYLIGQFAWLQESGDFTPFANFFFDNIPGFTHEVYTSISQWYED